MYKVTWRSMLQGIHEKRACEHYVMHPSWRTMFSNQVGVCSRILSSFQRLKGAGCVEREGG